MDKQYNFMEDGLVILCGTSKFYLGLPGDFCTNLYKPLAISPKIVYHIDNL